MKISNYFGMAAISQNKRKRGYVYAVHVLNGKIKYLSCADEKENSFYINAENVIFIDGNTLFFTGEERKIEKCKKIKLGKPSYSENGKFLGYLTDYEVSKNKLTHAYCGNRKYAVEDIIDGDVIIVKSRLKLKSDVIAKNGEIIFKRGETLSKNLLNSAKLQGEYIQTNLKSIN